MSISQLFSNPVVFLAWLLAIILVITIHEFAHALTATLLGDNTAKDEGRLTLNPKSHVSGFGLLMLVLVGFGWGNPVPFNPYNLRNQRFGPALIAIAGPLSNLLLAIFFIVIFKLIFPLMHPLFAVYGGFLPESLNLLAIFLSAVIFLNLILMLFNLLPIPPLDGSKLLFAFLPDHKFASFKEGFEKNGPFVLLGLLLLDTVMGVNIFGRIFGGFISFAYNLLG